MPTIRYWSPVDELRIAARMAESASKKFSMHVRNYGKSSLHTPRNVNTVSYELYKCQHNITLQSCENLNRTISLVLAYHIINKEVLITERQGELSTLCTSPLGFIFAVWRVVRDLHLIHITGLEPNLPVRQSWWRRPESERACALTLFNLQTENILDFNSMSLYAVMIW
jgi:hypothetical protein